MNFVKPALIGALLALSCGVGVTYAAPVILQERVSAVAPGPVLRLEATGNAVFGGLVFPDEALAEQWLALHQLQKPLSFRVEGTDRYGRSIIDAEGAGALLRDGVAVRSGDDDGADWMALEAQARIAKRGLWASKDLLLKADETPKHLLEFHLVEAKVTHIYEGSSATYLNFGEEWHTDFSVTIAKRDVRRFKKLLAAIHEGSVVRVRGALYDENGPMMRITRPEQMEIL